jgi:hypothetical protein
MQNKAKVKIGKMNLSNFSKKTYEKKRDWTLGENKPNQSQFQTGHHVMDWMKDKMLTGRPGAGRIPHD